MKIYRSERDKKIFGLCGGLAEAFQIDVTLIRLVLVVLAFFSGGVVIFIYLAASLVFPKEPLHDSRYRQAPPPYDNPYRSQDPYRTQDSYRTQDQYQRYESSRMGSANEEFHTQSASPEPDLDEMMKDLEKKALEKEILELKKKLEEYEKGEK